MAMGNSQHSQDFFAAMAAGTASPPRPDMEQVPAPERSPHFVPCNNNAAVAIPPAHVKLDTPLKLDARVRELHERYRPFLRDLTPPNPSPRPRLRLEQFVFRRETSEDRADQARPYGQTGEWEQVRVPHYTGPVGRWAAYYRTAFRLTPELCASRRIWIRFGAADYIAEVFVNGIFIGRHEGMFAPFGYDITSSLRRDGENTLLVRVENDAIQMGVSSWKPWEGYAQPVPEAYQLDGDKVYAGTGQGWNTPVGWNHSPPGAGLWQPVWIEGCAVTSIHDLFVRPFPEQKRAELWLETWRSDYSKRPTCVELTIHPNNFEGPPLAMGRHELLPAGPKLSLYKLALDLPEFIRWAPETPHLYTLRVRLISEEADGSAEDIQDRVFGMRSFVQDTVSPRRGTWYLNGEPIVLRGTNEMGNLSVPIQHGDPERTIGDLLISKAVNMNFWRITQRPVQPEVYDLCDRLGVMVQTDLPMFAGLRVSCMEETARQAGEMERLVRSHPCAVISSFINEPSPAAWNQHRTHRLVGRETIEDFFEVCINYTRLYNPDRITKCADGDYDPAPRHGMLDLHAYACMHEDHGVEVGKLHRGELFAIKKGWRCGVGEYGAEGLEPVATMRRHYPPAWLPPRDDDRDWTPDRIPMCQAWGWHHQWFERPDTFAGWVEATHRHQAWALRFMHEAYRRRADIINSTAIHLLINAWPNNWLKALISVDREPLPALFAYADANTPLAVNLRTDRQAVFGGTEAEAEIWLLNDTSAARETLHVVYWVEVGGTVQWINRIRASVAPISAACQGRLRWPVPRVTTPTSLTVHASLQDEGGEVLHDYVLPLTVFPQPDHQVLSDCRVAILGREGQRAWRLATAFGATPFVWSKQRTDMDLVIVDHADEMQEAAPALDAWVYNGGTLLGLSQPAGSVWHIGSQRISVRGLVGHQFVSRKTGHPAVFELDPTHFSLWYDRERERIAHLVNSGLEGENLVPITLTGHGIWYTKREEIPAGAEIRIGAGRAIFDQLWAPERMEGEPRAAIYLEQLLRSLIRKDPGQAPAQS